MRKKKQEKVYMLTWKLLNEWYHVEPGATEDDVLDVVIKGSVPTSNRRLISQRLFGGFECTESPGASHVFHDTGAYTYTGMNTDQGAEYRLKVWHELIDANDDQKFVDNVPFTSDRPNPTKKQG